MLFTRLSIPFVVRSEDRDRISRPASTLHKYRDSILGLGGSITVSGTRLMTYALFKEQSGDTQGFRTYEELQRKLPSRIALFEDYIEVSNGNIRLRREPVQHITESMGVAAALAVAEQVFPVTDADFEQIPETSRSKTFDYANSLVGSTGTAFVEIEAKGTHDGTSTYQQIDSIRRKKQQRIKHVRAAKLTDVAFAGVVLDLQFEGRKPTNITFCDPPREPVDADPVAHRLLGRMYYYLRHLRYITPRGKLGIALANRLEVLGTKRDRWRRLEGVKLATAKGKPIPVPQEMGWTILLGGRYYSEHRAFGTIVDLRLTPEGVRRWRRYKTLPKLAKPLLFVGLIQDVIPLLVKQDYRGIVEFKQRTEEIELSGSDSRGSVSCLPSGVVCGRIEHDGWTEEHVGRIINSW
jgi:hypothetical protein